MDGHAAGVDVSSYAAARDEEAQGTDDDDELEHAGETTQARGMFENSFQGFMFFAHNHPIAQVHGGSTTDGKFDASKPHATKAAFMERMVESAKATLHFFGKHITYINVMRNMSVDCDCAGLRAAPPKARNVGILASKDIVAIDQACIDLLMELPEEEHNDLKERIESREGMRQLEYGEEMGLGTRKYILIEVK